MELKLCVTGSRWYVSALCWLTDKWAEIGKSVTVEFTRNGRTMKKISKIKKSSMESAGSYSGHYSLFVTVSLQLFECQMNSLSTAGWPTTAQEGMIYRWVAPHTLYAASIIQQSSLQIDRPSLYCQRHPCWTIGSSIQAASRRKAALSRRLTVGELRGSTKAQYELKRINTVYWDSYSPALPMRFIASLTFLITYVQKWSDVDHVNASTDLYCLDRKTTPMLSWH